jgi:phosphopantothenoylcysteine decarboxylase/phosphopantothenate--cysteine ligase
MSKGKILFQLTGSIACFKACQLLSQLVQAGYEVEIAASKAALSFVGEATLEGLTGRAVHSEVFSNGEYMNHVHLIRWADAVVLCPATANTINKMAAGVGDDLISTMFLAHDFKKPYLVAPAMNDRMLSHPATQNSIATLHRWGIRILPTESGALACGDNGGGRLLEPSLIFSEIQGVLDGGIKVQRVDQMRVLVTAGGTSEPIDGVRSITNFSTGHTGASIAEHLAADGHQVTLLRAKDSFQPRQDFHGLRERTFVTFKDLEVALKEELSQSGYDVIYHAAAVSDFSVAEVAGRGATGKIESCNNVVLTLQPNPKLVDSLRGLSRNPRIKIVAFKLTNTTDIEARREAVHRLATHARPDFIVHNDLSEIHAADGGSAQHRARIFSVQDPDDLREIAVTDSKEQLAKTLGYLLKEGANAPQP